MYRKSAEQGNAVSQYYLGNCYYNIEGEEFDLSEEVRWFLKSVEQGAANAQYSFADCYYYRYGINQNSEIVIRNFKIGRAHV